MYKDREKELKSESVDEGREKGRSSQEKKTRLC